MTETAEQLREQPLRKVFVKYLVPSMLGLLLMSVNIVIDGIFIGHGVGANGLAAVNIAVPVFSFFYGIALWLGIGGATTYSIYVGQGKLKEARERFSLSFVTAVIATVLISLVSLWRLEGLAYFFGANDEIIHEVLDYMSVILTFGLVFVLESLLSIFIRNDGNPMLAMVSLIVAAVGNILLNYLFIFVYAWGVKGAAYATVLATVIAFFVMLLHFLWPKRNLAFVPFTWRWQRLQQILSIGFPSLISEVAIALVTLGYNIAFMRLIGELGVAAFSIVNYLHSMAALMFVGIGSALQPLVSFYYGAKLYERMEESLRFAVITALSFGLLSFGLGFGFAGPLTLMFNAEDSALYDLTVTGIRLFFINYIFLGINIVYSTYYQSVGLVKLSLLITVSRSILLVLLLLVSLPFLFGTTGVWLVVPIAEGVTVLIVCFLRRYYRALGL